MDEKAKKTALRMIPYGIYVLTVEEPGGDMGAGTINWVTQTSFDPPLIALGLKASSPIYHLVRKAGRFALNFLAKGQQGAAFGFLKPAAREGRTIGGEPFHPGAKGAPLLDNAAASVECQVAEVVERGDHHVVVAEVVEAVLNRVPEGRPDEVSLHMRDLGEKVFYGG